MSETPKKQRWNRGFVWGCLTPIIVVGIIVIVLAGYAGYYAFFAYKSDAAFQLVMADVQASSTARGILGDNIQLSGFPGYSYSYSTETGHTATYHFTAKGSKAEGNIEADLIYRGEQPIVRSLVLTAPNGLHYNLLTNKGSSSHDIRYIGRTGFEKPIAI